VRNSVREHPLRVFSVLGASTDLATLLRRAGKGMGGPQPLGRATWRIANLTSRDLHGQGSTLVITKSQSDLPGKDSKSWLGRSRRAKALLGLRKQPQP
jgi:hypothetical protein